MPKTKVELENQETLYKMKRDGTFVVPSTDSNSSKLKSVTRLLIVSSRARYSNQIENVKKPEVEVVLYPYEGSTLDQIQVAVTSHLKQKKADCIGFIFHGTEKELFVASGKILSEKSVLEDQSLQDFFINLITMHLDKESKNYHIDVIGCPLETEKADSVAENMEKILQCPVMVSKDLGGSDTRVSLMKNSEIKDVSIGEIYFETNKLKDMLASASQNLTGYEKIRTVGKGAFGTAVLYRKKDDDSLVILKEINMHDLTAAERQLAMNEIRVLSMLDHPNIVSYYDSFEKDGILMIEMEYADGGTLAQYLGQLKRPLDEQEILLLFQQIVSAIYHMHEHNVLHRDLKTANIFLTKEGIAKVGDFGISKMLTTRQGGANTVLGTPYYISPEMCEGKPYNQKSDIWALGCILYEMACLQKTFEGSNLPALVNKIVKGQFAPVRGNYSTGFKQLIRDLLQKDPEYRPTSKELLHNRLTELLKYFESTSSKYNDDIEFSMKSKYQNNRGNTKNSLKQPRTVLYQVKMHEMDISLMPVPLPPRSRIKEVALSTTHMIALTYDLLAYTWGDGRKGQLGHGMLEIWRHNPHCVDALKGKNIIRVCAGEGFSVFACDNGIVMTCGDGSLGCLGHGDWNCCIKPKLVEKLLSVDVSAISCGPHHVVVVSGEGDAYSWGCGNGGRLGIGKEDDCCIPTLVQLHNDVIATNVYCGVNGTMFVTETNSVLACGRNDHNKLGLNEPYGFLMQMKQLVNKTEVEKQLVPTRLRWLHRRVISISMGACHTALLVEPGHIITFGCNNYGQLGRGNNRSHSSPSVVKSMQDKVVTMVHCGNSYTVAATIENTVYFWGGRQITSAPSRIGSIDTSLDKDSILQNIRTYKSPEIKKLDNSYESDRENSVISDCSVSEVIKVGESNSPLMKELERIGPDSSIIQVKTPESRLTDSSASSRMGFRRNFSDDLSYRKDTFNTVKKDIVLQPQEILALYASPAQIARGETVNLSNLYCHANRFYLAIDTTAPVPKQKTKKNVDKNHHMKENGLKVNDSSDNSLEMDSMGPIPEWLKEELADAIIPGSAMENLPAFNHNGNDRILNYKIDQTMDTAKTKNSIGNAPARHKTAAHFRTMTNGTINSPSNKYSLVSPPQYKKNKSCHSNIPISIQYLVLVPEKKKKDDFSDVKIKDLYASSETFHDSYAKNDLKTTSPILCINNSNSLSSSAPAATLRDYNYSESSSIRSIKTIKIATESCSDMQSPLLPPAPPPSVNSEPDSREMQLRKELEQLIEDKKQTEEKLNYLETELIEQNKLQKQTEEKLKGREEALQEEITGLKNQLSKQHNSLRDYQSQMNQLQEQLSRLEMEQGFSPRRGHWSASPNKPRKSKICSVQ